MPTKWLANHSRPHRDHGESGAWHTYAGLVGRGGAVALMGTRDELFAPSLKAAADYYGLHVYPQMSIKHVRTGWDFLRHARDCYAVAKHFRPREMNVAMEINSNWTLEQSRRWLPWLRRAVHAASPGTRVWFSVQWEAACASRETARWFDLGQWFGTLGVSTYPELEAPPSGPPPRRRTVPAAIWECGTSDGETRVDWMSALDSDRFEFVALLGVFDMPWYPHAFFRRMGVLDASGDQKPGYDTLADFFDRGKQERHNA